MFFSSTRRYAALLTGLALLAGACHKDHDPEPLSVTASTDASAVPTLVPLAYSPPPPTKPLGADFAFDLDDAQYLPTPAGSPQVLAPWAPTASRAFSDDLRDDHQQAAGWALMYSTFSRSSVPDNGVLVLYNKYRGILRYYYYSPNGTPNLRDHTALASTVSLDGSAAAGSPLLSFADQAVVDPIRNSSFASSLEPQPLGTPIWYATQLELAYDQNIANYTPATLSLRWNLVGSQVSNLTLGGVPLGSALPVAIQVPGIDFTNNPSYSGLVGLRLTGPASLASLQRATFPAAPTAERILAQYSTDAWYQGPVPIQGAGAGALAYLPTPGQLSVRSDVGVSFLSFAAPGYDNSVTTGSSPQYNEAPGVFFLASPPLITASKLASGDQPYTYTLDVASVKYLFNPAVQTMADIRHVTQEIVATATGADLDGATYSGHKLFSNQELTIQGVRVAFDVIPKGGNAPVLHVVKTFKATIR